MPKYPRMELTQSQSDTLNVIFDTFLAGLTPLEERMLTKKIQEKESIYEIDSSQVSTMAQISATSINIQGIVLEFFENFVQPDKRAELLRVLDILATRPGSLLLTGYWDTLPELNQEKREQVMLRWKTSSFQGLRGLYNVLSGLCLFNAYSKTQSPLAQCIGYDAAGGDKFFENHPDYKLVQHEYIPMMTTEEATMENMEFDVIVVGSGAGGGVVAAELSQAGYSVLVIEKGKYFHQSEILQEEETAYADMYDSGTSLVSTNGAIQCLAGSTLGGGTALNYLVSLKPQYFVREEWAKLGLTYFTSPQFNKDLDRVFERIGASTENVLHTKTHEKFVSGCNQLGYHIESVPVNTGGRAHHCNRCMMGCKSGIKNSTTNTWLLDAMRNGARFLDRTIVTRVLTTNRGKKAIGVECCVHDSQQITTISAKQVIISCGSFHTPTVLKNSGFSNPNIGKNLRLQPICLNFGFFDESIKQTDGPLITSVCNASDDCQGDNYGAKIEEGSLLPGGLASKLPWFGAAKHKELMLRHRSMISLLNVVRDKDSLGVVEFDKTSPNPVYNYTLSKHDEKSMTVCIERSMKILVASGARELYSSQANVEPFVFQEDEESRVDNPRFIQWIETIRKAGIYAVSTPLISVHQLGSCRMGISPKMSVVQPSGETWEVKNLHVADGSLFPTAVGVNPMVTIEATALHVARNIISTMNRESRL